MLSQSLVPIIPFGALPTDYTRVKDSKQFSSFARTRTRFVRCLFLPTLPFRFLYCPGNFDDAWNIYFAFQCSEFRRNENVAAIRKIQSGWPVPFTLAIPSLKFLGDFRTFLAWSGHQLGHAQSSTVCLHDYTFPSKHTLCKFLASDYGNVIETQLEISGSILSRVKINYFEFVTSFLNWYFFYYYAEFWESLNSSLNRSEHVCEAKWDNWMKICIMRISNLSFMKSNWYKIIEMIVFKRILNFYNLNNILFDW